MHEIADLDQEAFSETSNLSVNAHFAEDVGFKFVGIPIGVKGINVSADGQYETFKSILRKDLEPRGGDGRLSGRLIQDPFSLDASQEWNQWTDSALARPDITGIGVDPLWMPMRVFTDPAVRAMADKIEYNWNWFDKLKVVHETDAFLDMKAGWGKITLVTDGVLKITAPAATGETWQPTDNSIQWTAAPNQLLGKIR